MKKIIIGTLVLFCMALFLPAAFAGDTAAPSGNANPRFKPTVRVGVAFDAEAPSLAFVMPTALLGARSIDLSLPSSARFYLATEIPFAVTDRLTVSLEGDWAFSGSGRELDELYNTSAAGRQWDADGTLHWVSTDLLVSYALIKDASVVKDLSVVAGLRWDYQTMSFTNPHAAFGVATLPIDTIDFKMQTLAPVFGLSCALTGIKSGIWGGDINLRALVGPVVWGHEDYTEIFGNATSVRLNNDLGHGYIVKVFADVTVLSGKIAPAIDGSLSIFAQFTKTNVKGSGRGEASSGITSRTDFGYDSSVFVFGIEGALAF